MAVQLHSRAAITWALAIPPSGPTLWAGTLRATPHRGLGPVRSVTLVLPHAAHRVARSATAEALRQTAVDRCPKCTKWELCTRLPMGAVEGSSATRDALRPAAGLNCDTVGVSGVGCVLFLTKAKRPRVIGLDSLTHWALRQYEHHCICSTKQCESVLTCALFGSEADVCLF